MRHAVFFSFKVLSFLSCNDLLVSAKRVTFALLYVCYLLSVICYPSNERLYVYISCNVQWFDLRKGIISSTPLACGPCLTSMNCLPWSYIDPEAGAAGRHKPSTGVDEGLTEYRCLIAACCQCPCHLRFSDQFTAGWSQSTKKPVYANITHMVVD